MPWRRRKSRFAYRVLALAILTAIITILILTRFPGKHAHRPKPIKPEVERVLCI